MRERNGVGGTDERPQVVLADDDQVRTSHERTGCGCPTLHVVTHDERPEEALPAERDDGIPRRNGRPVHAELAGHRPEDHRR